jgi:hypothetical protein
MMMKTLLVVLLMLVLTGIGRTLGMGESAILLGLAPLWLTVLFFFSVSIYFIRKTEMMMHLENR